MFKTIDNLNEVASEIVSEESVLIVLDIDETILTYNKIHSTWWKDTFEYFLNLGHDHNSSKSLALMEWTKLISGEEPLHIDKEGLFRLINNFKVLFITARHHDLRELTISHLNKLEIQDPEILFTCSKDKGPFLKEWLIENDYNFSTIYCIDDIATNLHSYHEHMKLLHHSKEHASNLKCYLKL